MKKVVMLRSYLSWSSGQEVLVRESLGVQMIALGVAEDAGAHRRREAPEQAGPSGAPAAATAQDHPGPAAAP